MNLSLDMNNRLTPGVMDMVDSAWLGGALAGLEIPRGREPDWEWAPFLEDLFDIAEMVWDVQPISPGEYPTTGSVLDSLGGYISLTGHVCNQGIVFPVNSNVVSEISKQLAGINIRYLGGLMVIPTEEIPRFMSIIPIRGPLEERVQEVAS
ncbi:MAG: hypothetical protein KAQ65_02220 [Candidatus Thorarchaeota archaeon]|nr:hypothetical protein [Candidatus Thorarchaeota archaeon]MCK5239976.1 hypothetical protein [Candidatus Thorarchaeota archaeon]